MKNIDYNVCEHNYILIEDRSTTQVFKCSLCLKKEIRPKKDEYQEKYLEHIENKLKREQIKFYYTPEQQRALLDVLENRKSIRKFSDKKMGSNFRIIIQKAIDTAPSSCNRKGIYYKEVTPEYAERVLVGGKNWVDKAGEVYFLFGAKQCYKNPKEIAYMPFLDCGFVAENIYLLCEIMGMGCCFINPNLKEPLESEDYFVGAVAIGNY